jgi:hypothetical protein
LWNSLHGDELATDKDGFFLLPNVTPEREFVLYSKMKSRSGDTLLPSVIFNTGLTGTRHDLGTLEPKPAHRVAGRIVLADDGRIPRARACFSGARRHGTTPK